MTSLARRVAPRAIGWLTSSRARAARRWLVERRRRLSGRPHRVLYFHQVDDPYSQLAAQLLPKLVARYDLTLVPHLVGPPSDATAPERERLAAFARRDAADVAPGYGLDRPGDAAVPADANPDALAGNRLRERLGHYLGGMFWYGGEWYWGVDRLHHLERRLRALGAARSRDDPLLAPRPDPSRGPAPASRERLALEFYPSLRSPYTAIAMDRVLALPTRLPVDLVLRPVLPMVMRGLPVPRAKRLYIVFDAKREAEDAGVAFGRVCDPVGRPVERCFSLYPWAREHGRAAELLRSFTTAAFAEGVDAGSDAGLRFVVERAGLAWREAREHLDREGWRDELEANRKQLLALGLWGVPSFRLLGRPGEPDYATWGQDRLWRVEQEIRRRVGPA